MWHHHLTAALLFALLSPGLILTLPAGSRGVFYSGQTSYVAIAVHTLIFALALCAVQHLYRRVYLEGFADAAASTNASGKPEAEACAKTAECKTGLWCTSGKCASSA
jgi:hypothetical protein